MENNDYSALDFLFPNYPKRVINEDASDAAAPAGAAPAPGMISNPPAETTVAKVTDAVPAWITDGIKYWEAELAKNPGNKEIEAELKRMKDMAEKGGLKESSGSQANVEGCLAKIESRAKEAKGLISGGQREDAAKVVSELKAEIANLESEMSNL